MSTYSLETALQELKIPDQDSHKGQNGKLLLIGGSHLFHSASKWSLDVASQFVDMVFYSSVKDNNELVLQAKKEFWNGIVVERNEIENYIQEADCVLIGPGMERDVETQELVDDLLEKYSEKKWVIDAGALQMVAPKLIQRHHIITPHQNELERLAEKLIQENMDITDLECTIILKGTQDIISWKDTEKNRQQLKISGGNAGMTKGGTGDVLAGLVAALYCTNSAQVSAVVASHTNKAAGDDLYKTVGPFFNASQLVEQVPKTVWQLLKTA